MCTLHHPPGPRPGTARPAGTPAAFQGQRQEVLEGWGCRQATGGPTRKAQPPTLGVFPRGKGGCVPLCTTPGGPSVPTEPREHPGQGRSPQGTLTAFMRLALPPPWPVLHAQARFLLCTLRTV